MLAHLPPAVPQLARQCIAWLEQRKVPAFVVAGALLLCVAAMATSSKLGEQRSLFSAPLYPSQVIEVERALTLWNESFTSDPQHTQIFVASSRRRDILLRLTLAGLPHRYVPTTADVLEQPQSAFVPETVIDDRRRAGIEGDLVAGLRRMNGIADANVVIAPAVDDPFAESDAKTPPSASVQLVLESGALLPSTAATGIKRFIAASYPGLSPDRVVVIDGSGAAVGVQNLPDKSVSREARLQSSIQSALDAVFGLGAAIVRVSVRPSGEERNTQSTRVIPQGPLETDEGNERGREGSKNFERERRRTRYAYDTVIETKSSHPDILDRVAVAVFLNAHKVSLAQSKLVVDLVRAAAGADLQRGDDVVVQALPFTVTSASTHHPRRMRLRFLIAGALAFCALLALGRWLWALLSQKLHERRSEAAVALHTTLENELPQTAAYVLRAMPARVRAQVLREYSVEQRERILTHLNGRAHG